MSAPRAAIAAPLLAWFDQHGRHDLPWQHPRTPYRVWLAEVMLQQTQVGTVIPYYQRFLQRFPDLATLAAAGIDEVLALWAGLGYYSRGRNLHRCAQLCMTLHQGQLPTQLEQLQALPGIGRSTAAAILAQAFGQRHAILDGNVRRVLCRYHAVEGWPGEAGVERRLWQLAEAGTPAERVADYTQAIMDLGATLCRRRRPDCPRCPLRGDCAALAQGRVEALPTARPRALRSTRRLSLLQVLDADGRLLLQRRPPTGIWGGLWSLPEVDWLEQDDAAWPSLQQWCAERRHVLQQALALPRFHHDFTHFRLQVLPWRLQLQHRAPTASVAEGGDSAWFEAVEIGRLGLPRPVQRLLAAV